MHFDLAHKRVFVAGSGGMVGSAIVRRLNRENCEILEASRYQLNLLDQQATKEWMAANKPDAVILAAAKVGGILANDTYPADFLYQNIVIASNVIEASYRAGVRRLLNLGSSCIYPKMAEQPIVEQALLTGPLEATNEYYAIAKIAGLKMAEAYRRQYGCDYISAMPTNLYGPGDNYDLDSSHVLPALIRKAHEAKQSAAKNMTIWGSGAPRREFLHANDCADACVFLLQHYSGDLHINVGSGEDISIRELADIVCDVVGYEGTIELDLSKPDGTPRKLMSGARLAALGWKPAIQFRQGITSAYSDFLEKYTRS